MASHDPHELPDVMISGALALDLLEALEWARVRARPVEVTARLELARMRAALDENVTEAAYRAAPLRWVVGVPPEDAPEGAAVLDEPPPMMTSGTVSSLVIQAPTMNEAARNLNAHMARVLRTHARSYLR
ncbi:hypothetical protein [Nocardiopsis alba]|uniref:hypothetical protein n=1 Tax=Nocardiopsis alba TaxID=53437 RepID=UPI003D71DBD5